MDNLYNCLMAKYCLFIDESGLTTPAYQPERPYILVGCAIDDDKRDILEQKANALKQRYWNRTNVIFHHSDLAKSRGVFSIFKDKPERKTDFKKDLIHYLHTAPVNVFVSIVNKEKIGPTWTNETLAKKTARAVFADYVSFLYTRNSPRGKIIIEASDSTKDKYYLDPFKYFLSPDCKHLDKDFLSRDIHEVITSITFVTKQNNDNETQIADILGYAAYCRYKKELKGRQIAEDAYEGQLIKALDAKVFQPFPAMGPEKMKFAKKVKGYQIISK